MIALSACLVIHNEESVLARCLKSLKGLVDEIIIVHDGPCRDRSLEIARQFNAQIHVRQFVGEAEYHRPFAFAKAKGKWFLHLDADEIINEKLKKAIPGLIAANDCDAYSFAWPYPDGAGGIKNGPFAKTIKPALFRKNMAYMIGLSHEFPRTYGRLCHRPEYIIDHRPPYDNFSFSVFRTKWINWAAIQAGQLKNLDTLPFTNITDKKNHPQFKLLRRIYNFPVLTGLSETAKYLIIYLLRGILFAGIKSLKIAFFEVSYIWFVRLNILMIKYRFTHSGGVFHPPRV